MNEFIVGFVSSSREMDRSKSRRLETPPLDGRESRRRRPIDEVSRRSRSRTRRDSESEHRRSRLKERRSPLKERRSPRDHDRLHALEQEMERERRRLRDLQDDLQRERNRIRWTVSNQRELDQPRFRSSEHSGTTENQARPSKRVRSPDIQHENSEPRRSRLEKHALQSDKSASPSFSTKDVMNILKSLKQLPSQPSTYSALTTSSNHKNILPDFDPSSKNQRIDSWLNKVNECATVYGWDEKTTIHFSMQKLQGLAKTWYESLPSILYNWTEWQSKLINAFPCEQNYGQTLEEMLRRKTKLNEPIEVYFYEKLAMLNQCNIEGKRAVDCIIHGLTDRTLKSSAITLRCTHPEQLLQFLMSNKESSHLIDRMHYKFIPGTDSSNLDNNNSSAYKVEKVMSQNNNIFCYNCKEKGHPFLKCPKPILKCGKCNKIGHRIEDCFSKVNDSNTV